MALKKKVTVTMREIRRRGKIDGRGFKWKCWPFVKEHRDVDPKVDQEIPSAYATWFIDVIKNNVDSLENEWQEADTVLKNECDNAEDRYIELKESLDKSLGEHRELAEVYRKAKEKFQLLPVPHLSAPAYWVLFIAISIAELFFNYTVFAVFGQEKLETFLVAAGLIIAMPLFSHFPGRYLAEESKDTTKTVICCITVVIILAGIGAIATLREMFFEASETTKVIGLNISSTKMMAIFVIFNIILYAALFLIAFESGHKDMSAYKQVKRDLKDAEKKLKKEAGDVEDDIKKLADARIAWNNAHSKRRGTFKEFQRKIEFEITTWITGVGTYEEANMLARTDTTPPVSFGTFRGDADKLFPEYMRSLECNCRFAEFADFDKTIQL